MNPTPPCWLQSGRVRHFSLARHALVAALRAAGIGKGARVLLPEFICGDVLAAIAGVGATPCWYPVAPDLRPATDTATWPQAAAVLAVNYFGFAHDLTPFRRYAARTGAILIEDNAHGFLSQDGAGNWLGCRADVGLFSFRKTAGALNGAACVFGPAVTAERLPPQLAGRAAPRIDGSPLKYLLRRLPLGGPRIAGLATGLAQQLRVMRTGHALPLAPADAESAIPGAPAPRSGLASDVAQFDGAAEIARRRELYKHFLMQAENLGVEAVYPELPAGTSPYGFAFRAAAAPKPLQREAARRGLDTIPWPALPMAVGASAPAHYRNVHLVNFLW